MKSQWIFSGFVILTYLGFNLAFGQQAARSIVVEPVADDGNANPFLVVESKGFISGSVRDIALSTDGQLLAAAGEKQVRVWNTHTGQLLGTLRGYQLGASLKLGRANAVAFSPDSKYLVVGVSDNTYEGSTRVYAMANLEKVHSLMTGHTACSDRVVFSPDGKYLLSYG